MTPQSMRTFAILMDFLQAAVFLNSFSKLYLCIYHYLSVPISTTNFTLNTDELNLQLK